MRIANNITAMNTHRMYTANNNAITKSAEKLSSGYRINRAGDDAAGLAISEKMRAQIRGLNMASKNSQDANSLIQTAEGALQEVHSMLQRMNELANQSATGTNENFDREQISAEFEQLKSEIDDISTQTNFNNMKLLDGSLASGAAKVKVDPASTLEKGETLAATGFTVTDHTGLSSAEGTYKIDLNGTDGTPLDSGKIRVEFTDAKTGDTKNTIIDLSKAVSGDFANGGAFKVDLSAAGMGTFEMTADNSATATAAGLATALGGKEMSTVADNLTVNVDNVTTTGITTAGTNVTSASVAIEPDALAAALSKAGLGEGEYSLSFSATGDELSLNATPAGGGTAVEIGSETITAAGGSVTIGGVKLNIAAAGSATANGIAGEIAAGVTFTGNVTATEKEDAPSGALKIQVGANEGEQLSISVEAMNVKGLGLTEAKISDQESASKAITATQDAINLVSEQRATLGAMQNRLEHKISNLDNTAENLSASESRIRDVDLAKEMTAFTKNQILSQAATAMLAQANSMPQNVLSLLQ